MKGRRIIRVFPRLTRATPVDDMVRVGSGPGLFDEAEEVHISVAFTWDLPLAEALSFQWERVAPVKIGGPATGMPGEDFVPGMYLRDGYTITSRGCPNRCWFCSVWKREGQEVRELPIRDGWNVLDDNLLACSERHIREVFSMLKRQRRKAEFTGGLEAARLKLWHVDLLDDLRPEQIFLAYDTPEDRDPVGDALALLTSRGFERHTLRAYVLCGYPSDTIESAEARMLDVVSMGAFPMAMLYNRTPETEWKNFQRSWARPALIAARFP